MDLNDVPRAFPRGSAVLVFPMSPKGGCDPIAAVVVGYVNHASGSILLAVRDSGAGDEFIVMPECTMNVDKILERPVNIRADLVGRA